jgi:mono/diheme cytochrome c family protein
MSISNQAGASPRRSIVDASRQSRSRGAAALFALACITASMLFASGCSQKMDSEPKFIPLRENRFFSDHKSARPLVDGTVPRGYLEDDQAFFTGKTGQATATASAASPTTSAVSPPSTTVISFQLTGAAPGSGGQLPVSQPAGTPVGRVGSANTMAANLAANVQPKTPGQTDINYFPLPVTSELVARGQDRFNIFCSPCHSQLGDGQGMIVKRGFRAPPSFHLDRLRQAPVGHFFDVITNGFGAMPDYAAQITPQDRWAIIAYIRALQLSQNATVADVPPDHKADLDNGGQQK